MLRFHSVCSLSDRVPLDRLKRSSAPSSGWNCKSIDSKIRPQIRYLCDPEVLNTDHNQDLFTGDPAPNLDPAELFQRLGYLRAHDGQPMISRFLRLDKCAERVRIRSFDLES